MKPALRELSIAALISMGLGALAILPVVNSENGYVAGFVFLPILLLLALIAFVLFVIGLITITKKAGPILLISSMLLPVGFFGAALLSRIFELGAYREEPMVPLVPETSNIVLLKLGTSEKEIEDFWSQTLSIRRTDDRGYDHLPGIRGIGRLAPREGHEIIEFSFFPNATEEQKAIAYSKIRSSPVVFKLLENVSTDPFMAPQESRKNDNRPAKEVRMDKLVNKGQ